MPGEVLDRQAKFRYTFVRPIRTWTGAWEMQFKDVTIYAYAWHDHEAQARARLPWGWTGARVHKLEVARI